MSFKGKWSVYQAYAVGYYFLERVKCCQCWWVCVVQSAISSASGRCTREQRYLGSTAPLCRSRELSVPWAVDDSCWKSKVVTRQMHAERRMAQPGRFRRGQFQSKLNSERWTAEVIFRDTGVPWAQFSLLAEWGRAHRKRHKPGREQLLGRAKRRCCFTVSLHESILPPHPFCFLKHFIRYKFGKQRLRSFCSVKHHCKAQFWPWQ